MAYRDNVSLAAQALMRGEKASWELARLTHDSTYGSGKIASQTDRVPMEQWCSDLREAAPGFKFSTGTGALYRRIWTYACDHGSKQDLSWHEAYAEVRGETQEERDEERAVYRARSAQPETKRTIFQELAADPAITQEMGRPGSPTSRAVGELQGRQEILRQEARERHIQSDPILRRIDQLDASLDVEQACADFARDLDTMTKRFAREISKALPRTGPGREQPLFWVRRSIMQARSSLDILEGYTESGTTDLDTFLSETLGGVR